ncbi:MAG: hypothetical protein LBI38_02240 [Oscillospiraceae bacterium]|jgi:hypothetical protein|nr:hypothetical protein [Oscillospiraceae bacterium]
MSNKPALIATVIVAVSAVAAVLFTAVKLTSDDEDNKAEPDGAEYGPTEETADEMWGAVVRLVGDNHTVLRLFYTVGMPHEEEAYGNPPEDGYYTAVTSEYADVEEIFGLVRNTFAEPAAERIINDPSGRGPVYKDKNGKIGVSEKFERLEYNINWENPPCEIIEFISDTECEIRITLTNGDGEPEIKDMGMKKGSDGVWRLDDLIF